MKKRMLSMTVVAAIIILGIVGTTMVMGKSKDQVSEVTVENVDMAGVNQEMFTLTSTIIEGLNDFDGIGDIQIDFHEKITVQTSLESSDASSIDQAIEIQKTVENILKSKELESISNIDSYQIYLLDEAGDVIE
ncbi:hypothetical protein [Halalkalibacter akibai]|uniref:DUF4030 domain-containing protein n=1 Tax=Halalkalibacter akibai (strain ATCC 43226 / DSM 21942 / CIP 109018 / JCM 9157 / 1139) TaxID=1236973 RepID=W4R1L7_HALA3|nr:hypothetical protein [Halalkalibacter akibai]GAE37419.1 hypothetical protein JCM9157_4718 [Halalkalibacter akibai JCM 9157]